MDNNSLHDINNAGENAPGRKRSRKRKILSSVSIILGLILIVAAAILVSHNLQEAAEAGTSALENSGILNEKITENIQKAEEESKINEEYSDQILNVDDRKIRGMPTEEIDGNLYIGQLEVPEVNVSLPIMYNWNYRQLRIAPCRFSGSYYSDDLVICGHNYRTHFSPLRSLSPGADVYFITVMGERIHYKVSNIETIRPTAIEDMIKNSNNSDSTSEWDMTLFTCTIGGRARYAIRCDREEEQ